MFKKNQGHGICGAKNLYSSTAKLGNWVEDTIGQDLVAMPDRVLVGTYECNSSFSYRNPADRQDELPPMLLNMPSAQELKAKNKEGMSYSLIFDHGLKEITPEERLITTNQLTIMRRSNTKEDLGSDKRLMRVRSKQVLEDFKRASTMTSEARTMNAHCDFRPAAAPQPMTGRMDKLPRWHRVRTLTSTIPEFR
ncbi:hypothetical protein B484DRAFT_65817 [Ochromonadaceae sp. CCMP2298]|nr:hypothetical protein B484DRAFT_476343 [Ochromonadaceae sp. CCMP2298]KAJ1442379.1 hypothetical protein B484DRAFT_65817 [Ochromonadaceae sp. CCMP2298]|mmetsp:Transcript_9841/g.21902  ORF Transcript_9841/g.21902 Transcript_9841/m.21902 type:complete len:194 (+) Transcript_9841:121-702(+)